MTLIKWEESTWEEIRDACSKGGITLIPVGSIEQHGPHLPLGTDYLIADAIAERTGEEVRDLTIIKTPPLPYGLSSMWEAYPGTVTLTTNTYLHLIKELIHSVIKSGCRKVIIVNGHAGNSDGLRVACRDAVEELGMGEVATVTLWDLCGDIINKSFHTRFFHADEVESSIALALGLRVRGPFKPAGETHRKYDDFWHSLDLTVRPKAYVFRPESKVMHGPGSFGRPDLANSSKGKALVNCLIKRLGEFLKDFQLRKV